MVIVTKVVIHVCEVFLIQLRYTLLGGKRRLITLTVWYIVRDYNKRRPLYTRACVRAEPQWMSENNWAVQISRRRLTLCSVVNWLNVWTWINLYHWFQLHTVYQNWRDNVLQYYQQLEIIIGRHSLFLRHTVSGPTDNDHLSACIRGRPICDCVRARVKIASHVHGAWCMHFYSSSWCRGILLVKFNV